MECSSFGDEAAVATSDSVGTQTFTDFLVDVETNISPPLVVQPARTFNTNDANVLNAEWRDDRLAAIPVVVR